MIPPLGLGFVGLGPCAESLAAASRRCPGLRIAGGHDPLPERRAAFAARFGGTPYDDLRALADDPAIAAVVVASPNHTHAEVAIALAQAGKHVFVEKPMCTTLADADRMIAACRANRVQLAVGHQERRLRAYRRIRRMLRDGEIGAVRAFTANHCGNLLPGLRPDDWRLDPACGSGPLLHKGIHKLDVLNALFGRALTVASLATPLAAHPAMAATTVSILAYTGGVVGTLSAGFAHHDASFSVHGERLSVAFSGHGATLEVRDQITWETQRVECGEVDPLVEELDEFARAVRGEGGCEVDGAAGRAALALALAADHAARSGRLVELAADPAVDISSNTCVS